MHELSLWETIREHDSHLAEHIDWKHVRSLFPGVLSGSYLNTAGGGAMSTWAAEAGRQYYDEAEAHADRPYTPWMAAIADVRARLGQFLGTDPQHLAFLANASLGFSLTTQLVEPSEAVLVLADEFPSVTLPWLERGHPVQFVPTEADGQVSMATLAKHLTPQTRVLATSWVQYASGFRWDLTALHAFCRDHDLLLFADATQALGAIPIDLRATPLDVLIFSGYKWLGAGYGIAGLYVRPDLLKHHPVVGWRSARQPYILANDHLDLVPTAQSLEGGHPPLPGVLALGGALRLIESVGIDAIAARITRLTSYLHQQLGAAGFVVTSPRAPAARAGITTVAVADPGAAAAHLAQLDILVSARRRGLRISVHFYNNEADIDALVTALNDIPRESLERDVGTQA